MMERSPKYFVYIAMNVDGYIAKLDGDVSWLELVSLPNEDYGYGEFIKLIDTIVMGRHSYEKALTYPEWPYQGKRVIVLSVNLEKRCQLISSKSFSSGLVQLQYKL